MKFTYPDIIKHVATRGSYMPQLSDVCFANTDSQSVSRNTVGFSGTLVCNTARTLVVIMSHGTNRISPFQVLTRAQNLDSEIPELYPDWESYYGKIYDPVSGHGVAVPETDVSDMSQAGLYSTVDLSISQTVTLAGGGPGVSGTITGGCVSGPINLITAPNQLQALAMGPVTQCPASKGLIMTGLGTSSVAPFAAGGQEPNRGTQWSTQVFSHDPHAHDGFEVPPGAQALLGVQDQRGIYQEFDMANTFDVQLDTLTDDPAAGSQYDVFRLNGNWVRISKENLDLMETTSTSASFISLPENASQARVTIMPPDDSKTWVLFSISVTNSNPVKTLWIKKWRKETPPLTVEEACNGSYAVLENVTGMFSFNGKANAFLVPNVNYQKVLLKRSPSLESPSHLRSAFRMVTGCPFGMVFSDGSMKLNNDAIKAIDQVSAATDSVGTVALNAGAYGNGMEAGFFGDLLNGVKNVATTAASIAPLIAGSYGKDKQTWGPPLAARAYGDYGDNVSTYSAAAYRSGLLRADDGDEDPPMEEEEDDDDAFEAAVHRDPGEPATDEEYDMVTDLDKLHELDDASFTAVVGHRLARDIVPDIEECGEFEAGSEDKPTKVVVNPRIKPKQHGVRQTPKLIKPKKPHTHVLISIEDGKVIRHEKKKGKVRKPKKGASLISRILGDTTALEAGDDENTYHKVIVPARKSVSERLKTLPPVRDFDPHNTAHNPKKLKAGTAEEDAKRLIASVRRNKKERTAGNQGYKEQSRQTKKKGKGKPKKGYKPRVPSPPPVEEEEEESAASSSGMDTDDEEPDDFDPASESEGEEEFETPPSLKGEDVTPAQTLTFDTPATVGGSMEQKDKAESAIDNTNIADDGRFTHTTIPEVRAVPFSHDVKLDIQAVKTAPYEATLKAWYKAGKCILSDRRDAYGFEMIDPQAVNKMNSFIARAKAHSCRPSGFDGFCFPIAKADSNSKAALVYGMVSQAPVEKVAYTKIPIHSDKRTKIGGPFAIDATIHMDDRLYKTMKEEHLEYLEQAIKKAGKLTATHYVSLFGNKKGELAGFTGTSWMMAVYLALLGFPLCMPVTGTINKVVSSESGGAEHFIAGPIKHAAKKLALALKRSVGMLMMPAENARQEFSDEFYNGSNMLQLSYGNVVSLNTLDSESLLAIATTLLQFLPSIITNAFTAEHFDMMYTASALAHNIFKTFATAHNLIDNDKALKERLAGKSKSSGSSAFPATRDAAIANLRASIAAQKKKMETLATERATGVKKAAAVEYVMVLSSAYERIKLYYKRLMAAVRDGDIHFKLNASALAITKSSATQGINLAKVELGKADMQELVTAILKKETRVTLSQLNATIRVTQAGRTANETFLKGKFEKFFIANHTVPLFIPKTYQGENKYVKSRKQKDTTIDFSTLDALLNSDE